MEYSIQKIKKIIEGVILNQAIEDDSIAHLLLDSRQIIFPKTSLFFAIPGRRHDGHHFIDTLYKEGIRNFVIEKEIPIQHFPRANFVLVSNSIQALQKLTAYHRSQFNLKTIGITGSNGKTIIKEWLFQLLYPDYHVVRSPKSYNSQIGVPLSIWQIQQDHDLGIFEAGISQVGEMENLAPLILCDIGVFTNIGGAHDMGFSSRKEKVKEKLKLFETVKKIIYCKDHGLIHQAILESEKPYFSWSTQENADLQITRIDSTSAYNFTKLQAIYKDVEISIKIPFNDAGSIENAIHCWAVLLFLGIDQITIQKRMEKLEPVAMRLELKAGIHNCTLINDSYNSDVSSLNIALNFLDQQGVAKKKTLILSDILQSGQQASKLYKQVADLIKEKKVNRFLGIGEEISSIQPYLSNTIEQQFFKDTNQFLGQLDHLKFNEETILIKGARKFAFEKIANSLAQKVHRTTLEINLNALSNNLNVYHKYLNQETKMMVMVKAAAYGLGGIELAKLMEFHQVDYLAVAYEDEGIELRQRDIQLPILVLNPEKDNFSNLIKYHLEPEIYSLPLLRAFGEFTSASHLFNYPVHLKLDTGMNRLGFTPKVFPELLQLLSQYRHLKVQSIFSHLAASETARHDEFTFSQVQLFQSLYDQIVKQLNYRPVRHILNSSGIVRFPQYQMEMVRLGIGLYGVDSTQKLQNQLQAVLTLKARVSQIKEVRRGDTVGYGRSGVISSAGRIATVSIGYADGLLRLAGNGHYHFQIREKVAPIIGNICMDMCMVDISHIPEAQEGDEVIIFGQNPSIKTLAEAFKTIPYEVLTNISGRVKRLYVQE